MDVDFPEIVGRGGNGEADRNLFTQTMAEDCDLGFPGFSCVGCPFEKDSYAPPDTLPWCR